MDSVSGPFGAELGLMNGMKKYPMLVSAGEHCFEIILLCRRPEFPAGLAFRILDGKLAGKQRVSYFYHPNAANLDSDAAKEFAGEFNMDPAAKPNTIYYNPILYYELRETGIALDSALTIEKNKAIFGRFLGYDFILKKVKKDKGGKMRAARAAELRRIESLQ